MNETNEYEVSVHCNFDAMSAEDAVIQMIEWLQEAASSTGYRVENLDTGESLFLDAEDIDLKNLFRM